jgi:hypothetical protein
LKADDVFLSHFPSAERLENFMNEVVHWCPPCGEVKAKSVIFYQHITPEEK